MLTLYQRLIFGYVLLLALLLAVGVHDSLSLHQAAALDHRPSVSAASAAAAGSVSGSAPETVQYRPDLGRTNRK